MLAIFVYLLPPGSDGTAVVLSVVVMIWQGILLWKAKPEETQAPDARADRLDQA